MPIQVSCGECQKQFRIPDKFAGKTIKCPGCQSPLKLPAAASPAPAGDTSLQVHCGSCQNSIRISEKYAGKRVKCPQCGSVLNVPGGSPSTAMPPAAAAAPPRVASPPVALPPAAAPVAAPPPPRQGVPEPAAPEYQPVLKSTGKSKSLANMAVGGELKKSKRGNSISNSMIYQVGQSRSFWERVKAGTHVGPFVKQQEVSVDQIHLMTISDPAGPIQMAIPYDNGSFCPIEFLSVLPGRLPASLGLLRGEGGNWGIETSNSAAGVFLPQYMRSAMTAMGSQAKSVWVVLDENQPQAAAEVANRSSELRQDLRFDAKLKMGPMEITYHIDWIAQALPLGEDQYLLIAQYIPVSKMFGVGLGASWFIEWRQKFLRMASGLPSGSGGFHPFDYGVWGNVAHEVMGLKVF